jgi:predicted ribosomally synthesized peptide with nif11-like leader
MAKATSVWCLDIGQVALKALKVRTTEGELQVEAFEVVEHAKILSQPDADRAQLIRVSLEQFLAHVQADPALRRQVSEAITADEVSLLAQALGYLVSGSDLLRFSGRSAAGVRVTRIDHPGEYPGRYV